MSGCEGRQLYFEVLLSFGLFEKDWLQDFVDVRGDGVLGVGNADARHEHEFLDALAQGFVDEVDVADRVGHGVGGSATD